VTEKSIFAARKSEFWKLAHRYSLTGRGKIAGQRRKRMAGYKTVVIAVLMFLAYALEWPKITEFIDAQYVALGTSLVMAVLRFFTETKVFTKKS